MSYFNHLEQQKQNYSDFVKYLRTIICGYHSVTYIDNSFTIIIGNIQFIEYDNILLSLIISYLEEKQIAFGKSIDKIKQTYTFIL